MSTKRTGKCINFGNCAKADRYEMIELDVTEDFVCPECNSDLEEGPSNPPKRNLLPIIIVVIVLLLGGGAAAFFLLGDKEEDDAPIFTQVDEEPETEPEPVVVEPEPEPEIADEEPEPAQKPTTPVKTSGTVSVTGGSYTGELKDGKPHGMGTIKYNSSTLIDSRDAKQRRAEAGQYITGEFHNGRLVQGKLYDKNNNQLENIILGRAN